METKEDDATSNSQSPQFDECSKEIKAEISNQAVKQSVDSFASSNGLDTAKVTGKAYVPAELV